DERTGRLLALLLQFGGGGNRRPVDRRRHQRGSKMGPPAPDQGLRRVDAGFVFRHCSASSTRLALQCRPVNRARSGPPLRQSPEPAHRVHPRRWRSRSACPMTGSMRPLPHSSPSVSRRFVLAATAWAAALALWACTPLRAQTIVTVVLD